MRYYRLSFKRVTTPDPARPDHRHWEWFAQIVEDYNLTFAKHHGRQIAEDKGNGIKFVDAIPLLKVVGAVEIGKHPGFYTIA